MKVPRLFIVQTIFAAFLLSGCAVLRNMTGNSLTSLQRVKDYARFETLDCGLDECFDKVLTVVKGKMSGVNILKINRRKYSILLLVVRRTLEEIEGPFAANCADVAIFLQPQGADKTKIEINSLSSLFSDYTAEKIFAELKPPPQPAPTTIEEPKEAEE